jgi:hypothetical protein
MLDFWQSHFMKVLDRHAPLIKRRVINNKLPGWFITLKYVPLAAKMFFYKAISKKQKLWHMVCVQKWTNRTVHIIRKIKRELL